MTINQLISHQEQMAAYRRDFQVYWNAFPFDPALSERERMKHMGAMWREWLTNKRKQVATQ